MVDLKWLVGLSLLLALPGVAQEAPSSRSCASEVGSARAAEYVRQCRDVSPATRPPCNARNPCWMMVAEIARGCRFLNDAKAAKLAPFCAPYLRQIQRPRDVFGAWRVAGVGTAAISTGRPPEARVRELTADLSDSRLIFGSEECRPKRMRMRQEPVRHYFEVREGSALDLAHVSGDLTVIETDCYGTPFAEFASPWDGALVLLWDGVFYILLR